MAGAVDSLRKQISACEATLHDLRRQLAEAEHNQDQKAKAVPRSGPQATDPTNPLDHDMNFGVPDEFRSEVFAILQQGEKPAQDVAASNEIPRWPLEKEEYKRYGRQLIMPEIGLQGQLRLKHARVLIVGVGGLGCPAAAYLAGAGVGTIGLVDGDVVEESNLHRQVLHSTARVGMTKVESAIVALDSLNPNVELVAHNFRLSPETAISTFQDYDIVLDCTDSPASRYLISDTCVLLSKVLVSASALRIDGQMIVLNNPPLPPGDTNGGPCYRCVFPKPPPPESVVSCGDGGILGPVVGVMGVLQALEAIKVLTKGAEATPPEPPSLLLFSAYSNPMFRSMRLRSRKAKCVACSTHSTINAKAMESGSLDYVQFCGGALANPDPLSPEERISAQSYAQLRSGVNPFTGTISNKDSHILVDVREKVQFDLCSIEGSVNVPFSTVSTTRASGSSNGYNGMEIDDDYWVTWLRQTEKPIFVVCRLGNDSQVTVRKMKQLGLDAGGKRYIGDIKGGLQAWKKNVDTDFPDY
ncbi:molybdenum cofactor biosynthetic [Pyrenophora seminiperda CCB06]|uniref:Adenylyltransferase and sulfurtransferase uba4 n=1 Tax=Pyrenophora seminiperda CCB06 TaxID=1302712 RepID=A0A3M7LYR6_9PLEO|nr:molybdenum cofactor biosynthetic [Pyrenophora seminiperda CCB06]